MNLFFARKFGSGATGEEALPHPWHHALVIAFQNTFVLYFCVFVTCEVIGYCFIWFIVVFFS